MADPTVSVSLFEDLERYNDSKLLIARRVKTVSGLRGVDSVSYVAFWQRRTNKSPLITLAINGIRMHPDFGEEIVEQTE